MPQFYHKVRRLLQSATEQRVPRVLTFFRYDVDANRLLRQLNWKDLSTQFQIQKALTIYKSSNDLVPRYLSSTLC